MKSKPASKTPPAKTTPVKFFTYTPPTQTSAVSSADATAESLALLAGRKAAGRVPSDSPKIPLNGGPLAADGLPEADPASDLSKLEPRVRMMLAVTEFVGQLKVAASGKGAMEATVHIGSQLLATVPRPTADTLLNKPEGFPGVLAAISLRRDQIDEIQVQRVALETHVLQVMGRSPENFPACAELAQVVIEMATVLVQQLKHHFSVPRPSELSGAANPVLQVPGHSSFPSGHALQSMAVALTLTAVCKESAVQQAGMQRLAIRIADNRVVAGLHYPVDGTFGLALGGMLAACLAKGSGSPAPEPLNAELAKLQSELGSVLPSPSLPIFHQLWTWAVDETKPKGQMLNE